MGPDGEERAALGMSCYDDLDASNKCTTIARKLIKIFFKIPTAYVQVGPRLGHTLLGFENLLPVSSEKFKMAAKNRFFANNSRPN